MTEDESLSPNQVCLLKEQNEKKAAFDSLPEVLKQLSGDSQLIALFPLNPSRKELDQAIAKVPETPNSRGWGTPKEGHAYTVSGYVVRRSEMSDASSKQNVSLFKFSLGQPGRPFMMPIEEFQSDGSGLRAVVNKSYIVTPSLGLPEDRKPYRIKVRATMQVQPVSERVFLVSVDDRGGENSRLNYEPKRSFLVRTYEHQEFATNDLWQDWPVYDDGPYESPCDSTDAR